MSEVVTETISLLLPSTSCLDEFFLLEVGAHVEALPEGEDDKRANGEQGEEDGARVGRLVRVAVLLLALTELAKLRLELLELRLGANQH